jgi:RNA polymerase sigma-54 factor
VPVKQSLQLKLGQQLTMTPQLQQAIRLLQLSALDLQTEIQTALETNPLLELSEESNPEDHQSETPDPTLSADFSTSTPPLEEDLMWDARVGSRSQSSHEPLHLEIESTQGTAVSLRDHLVWQMQLTPFGDTDYLIATALIDAINESGFLSCSLEDIVATLNQSIEVDVPAVEAVLHRIQHFDPIGVGARDIGEYLTVQLNQLPPNTPCRAKAKDLIAHYLDLLIKHDYATLKRRLGLTLEQLHEVIHCIQSLNARPDIERGGKTLGYVVPDVYAYKKEGQWKVVLNPECTPPLKINPYYAALIRRGVSSEDNQYLRNHLQEAQWFLKSITHRNETLLKVARCIVDAQHAFLENGEEAMKPLVLHNIAQSLSLHESTISRVTTQKYLQTPRGTFELKYFFSSGVQTEQGGECSSTAIRAHIRKLVAAENRKKPYSDNTLTKLLVGQGIQVARRTVAKYREALNIPPSHERKQWL